MLTKEDFLAPYHFAAVVHDGGVGWLTSPLSLPSHAEEERLSSCCSIQARKGGSGAVAVAGVAPAAALVESGSRRANGRAKSV